jgi:ABC-type transporter Mla maintaining outer membrane lipid asymmetry ATPase subunit MlaF
MPYSVELKSVALTYGVKTLFSNVTLTLADGNMYVIVGSSG